MLVQAICRRGVDARAAIARAAQERTRRPHALRADIKDAYGSVSVDTALEALRPLCNSPRLFDAVTAMLHAPRPRGARGLPAGHTLSPLLLNLVLTPVDRALAEAGYMAWRYADDVLVLGATDGEVRAALALLEEQLAILNLQLNEDKTELVRPDQVVTYLSWDIRPDGTFGVSQAAVDELLVRLAVLPEEKAWKLLWVLGDNYFSSVTTIRIPHFGAVG